MQALRRPNRTTTPRACIRRERQTRAAPRCWSLTNSALKAVPRSSQRSPVTHHSTTNTVNLRGTKARPPSVAFGYVSPGLQHAAARELVNLASWCRPPGDQLATHKEMTRPAFRTVIASSEPSARLQLCRRSIDTAVRGIRLLPSSRHAPAAPSCRSRRDRMKSLRTAWRSPYPPA